MKPNPCPPWMLPSVMSKRELSLSKIDNIVAKAFGLLGIELQMNTRQSRIAWPRQVAMFLARRIRNDSLHVIGDHYGKDHGTVMYACQHVCDMIETYPELGPEINAIEARIIKGCR